MRLKIAVVGVGYMGWRHALKYSQLGSEAEVVALVDPHPGLAKEMGEKLGCRWFADTSSLFESGVRVDAASVASPTVSHCQIAGELLERGVHCLVEKPLAVTSAEARELEALASRQGLVLIPGHIERFNPAIQVVKARNPRIAYMKSYRVGPMSFRSIDIDVIKDVMIHDIDLALYLAGDSGVTADVVRVVSSPEGIHDVANVHFQIGDHMFADFTASRLAVARRRKLRMFTTDGYYSVDCGQKSAMYLSRLRYYQGLNTLRLHQVMGNEPTPEEIFDAVGATSLMERGRPSATDALRDELQYFLGKIRGTERREVVSATDGTRSVELTEAVLDYGRDVGVLEPGESYRESL